jgi:hypothetical protein
MCPPPSIVERLSYSPIEAGNKIIVSYTLFIIFRLAEGDRKILN